MEKQTPTIRKINKKMKNLQHLNEVSKKKAKKFEHEVRKTTATSIAAAFSFIIALFWRDAVQELITKLLEHLGLANSSYIAKVIAAALVTVIGVLAIMRISKWGELDSKNP